MDEEAVLLSVSELANLTVGSFGSLNRKHTVCRELSQPHHMSDKACVNSIPNSPRVRLNHAGEVARSIQSQETRMSRPRSGNIGLVSVERILSSMRYDLVLFQTKEPVCQNAKTLLGRF